MIQQLLALLPREIGSVAMLLGIVGALLGVVLWLGGSRFNRAFLTLTSVSTGAVIGLKLPAWFGWPIEGWATAVLGALVLGISGFVLYKVWVGLGLGVTLALWTALATFALNQGPIDDPGARPWVWPVITLQTTPTGYACDIWNSLSDPTRRVLPFFCGLAVLSGLAASILWPRLGTVLLYSCAGISLLVSLGILVLSSARPQWLGMIPSRTSSQIMMLLAMVAFGAVMQWRCVPRRPSSAPSSATPPRG